MATEDSSDGSPNSSEQPPSPLSQHRQAAASSGGFQPAANVPLKRGRGRPPKVKDPAQQQKDPAPAPATRPRGRPPKSADEKPKPPVSSGRPRGRPPKKAKTESDVPSTAPTVGKRGRGRPPKEKPAATPVSC